LGLSVCHGIVSEHRGRIQVTNRPEGGAIFLVEFPIFAGENADEMDSLSTIDETAGGATPA